MSIILTAGPSTPPGSPRPHRLAQEYYTLFRIPFVTGHPPGHSPRRTNVWYGQERSAGEFFDGLLTIYDNGVFRREYEDYS